MSSGDLYITPCADRGYGDTHYLIEKNNEDAHTATTIYALDEEQSVQELARILGGAQITDAVMDSAREMRELAIHKKAEIRQSIS